MAQVEESFRKSRRKLSIEEIDDMLSLLEGVYDSALTKKEDYYIQIALIHLLVGYPHDNTKYSEATLKINDWIYQLRPIINDYRMKHCHGKVWKPKIHIQRGF